MTSLLIAIAIFIACRTAPIGFRMLEARFSKKVRFGLGIRQTSLEGKEAYELLIHAPFLDESCHFYAGINPTAIGFTPVGTIAKSFSDALQGRYLYQFQADCVPVGDIEGHNPDTLSEIISDGSDQFFICESKASEALLTDYQRQMQVGFTPGSIPLEAKGTLGNFLSEWYIVHEDRKVIERCVMHLLDGIAQRVAKKNQVSNFTARIPHATGLVEQLTGQTTLPLAACWKGDSIHIVGKETHIEIPLTMSPS